MDYKKLSLEDLKKIAREKGITFGNIGKEKLIEKIKSFDSEHSVKLLADGTGIEEDITCPESDNTSDIPPENSIESGKKENVICQSMILFQI